jgi:hypothetical protein
MAMMMGNLCRALKKAGADEDSARKAAEEVATYGGGRDLGCAHREPPSGVDVGGRHLAPTLAIVGKLFLAGP